MSRCEEIRRELEAFLSGDLEASKKSNIQDHLLACQDCSTAIQELTDLSQLLQSWPEPEPPPYMYQKLKSRLASSESGWRKALAYRKSQSTAFRVTFRLLQVALVVAATLSINYLVQTKQESIDEKTTINFFMNEHKGAVQQAISKESTATPQAQLNLAQEDILFYEFLHGSPEHSRPGIVVRGPVTEKETNTAFPPAISKGHDLSLVAAQKAVNFSIVVPQRLHPAFIFDRIRKIDEHNSLHLLYTNGIHTLSLFQQPLAGTDVLSAQDFREYAVYRSENGANATVLAWRHHDRSFVLIADLEMAQLMDIAQSINAQ